MADEKLRVAIIGCGRMGQHYTDVYNTFENTEVVAIAEYNDDRRNVVGERFGVKALYKDAEEMYQKMDEVPDLAAVVLPWQVHQGRGHRLGPGRCARRLHRQAHRREALRRGRDDRHLRGTGRRLPRRQPPALPRRRSGGRKLAPARRLTERCKGATVHSWGGEISGGGCQHIAVLRILTNAEITEVIAWGKPQDSLEANEDSGLIINGRFKMSTGIETTVYGEPTPSPRRRRLDGRLAPALGLGRRHGHLPGIRRQRRARQVRPRSSRRSPGRNTATSQARSCRSSRPSRTAPRWRYPATTC